MPNGRIYNIRYYNLDTIISIGYCINPSRATKFCIWATNIGQVRDAFIRR
ncbi:RhuM family protein [uncultured Bacteroides sp.]